MPVPLRMPYHKAEAKYNVTTEFPSLGLHSAAATGNVGLVEYALYHGQPINSVLDGVLPLHAACAGGNVQVVKVLIDHGADVNAPRLPRKYSNDKNRDSSAPIVGTSGSTPLHFAAANGNTDVVTLLLLHGAHADRADKHGVTPEMLAQQNGWVECAKVLNDWILNKDQDLRDREGYDIHPGSSIGQHAHEQQPSRSPETIPSRKSLHVKQSIDTALNMLKSTDSQSRTAQSSQISTLPSPPHQPFGEYSFYPVDPTASSPIDPTARRPSLPHVLQLHANEHIRDPNSSFSNSLPENPYQRRPRSAGTGSDQTPEQEAYFPVYGRGGYGRKLGSKYSLLNIFKKAQPGETSGSSGNLPEASSNRHSPGDSEFFGSTVTLPLPITQSRLSQLSNTDLNENPNSTGYSTSTSRSGFRFHRGSDASNKGTLLISQTQSLTSSPPPMTRKASGSLRTPPRSNIPLAFELHLSQQQQHRIRPNVPGTPNEVPRAVLDADERGKPSSPLARFTPIYSGHNTNTSVPSLIGTLDAIDKDAVTSSDTNLELESGKPSPSPRPGILRPHNRISSTGQGSASNPRTLRFDSSPSNDRRVRDKTTDSPTLKSYDSSGSLSRLKIQTNGVSEQESRATLIDVGELEHEDNYGLPILPDMDLGSSLEKTLNVPSVLLQRQRGQSFTSSSESSLSPILTGDNVTDPTMTVINADFPFSINQPPSLMTEDHEDSSSPRGLLAPISADTRNRGDSLSSDSSTSDSRNPQLSFTSDSGTSPLVSTPGNGSILPQESDKLMSFAQADVLEAVNYNGGLNQRRAHAPLDIDITSISSHAQAEALVERARQEALDFANTPDLSPLSSSTGRTPLSAMLAAYGESLALERKLREQKESTRKDHVPSRSAAGLVLGSIPILTGPDGVERQLSLENNQGVEGVGRRPKDPRRPSTADGRIHSPNLESTFTGRSASHQSSRSTSAANHSPTWLEDLTQSYSPMQLTRNTEAISPYTVNPVSSTKSEFNQLVTSQALHAPPDESLSCISSCDGGADAEIESPPLYRVSTAPLSNPVRGKREVRSANKLTRMGYPANEQAVTRPSPPTPPTSKRFGAIKSLMQTFKGKA
ncbi:hypothetical protein BYT27DRAFT_7206524 [Phlegmacium glaucopus]|nr:hypothetical protein BYT27DRAFT_7206524 [Phlegmacium glaucopus]